MTETVILKLGGSVITDKSGECAIDNARLREIAGDIARSAPKLVLVHGAGSCGHPEARRYRINDGLDAENVPGVYHTHAAVLRLNAAVVGARRYRINDGLMRRTSPGSTTRTLPSCA
ncbi:amino acid kinase family protein [Methanoculleus bourgensis]|uniref:Aspartate/glutamate/uridylate kinase domain-containing protein n=1 Tax=Methanoculleus bourgensis TaxID=83986 RepID=A0A0X3BKD5_9EURY|nr:protein of unknown function [Methanoculleus bourgensis]